MGFERVRGPNAAVETRTPEDSVPCIHGMTHRVDRGHTRGDLKSL
jgi:hypothetical protein